MPSTKPLVLVTGGTGYIGSHTVVELIQSGFTPIIADNLSNSKKSVLRRIEKITGHLPEFHQIDLKDTAALDQLFSDYQFDSVLHFAGLKAVGESVQKPLKYYRDNITITLNLLDTMNNHGVKKLIFSSSAGVYGNAATPPVTEKAPTGSNITNPYAQTKYIIEQILIDQTVADPTMQITALRYFNAVGAHSSGLIGESPSGTPSNLIPYVSQAAAEKIPPTQVFGNDYDTPDGTGIRDYIHVVDLSLGHIAALDHIKPGFQAYNLGTGTGTSVLEVINIFSQVVGRDLPYEIAPRRPGDMAISFASPKKAAKELNWQTKRSIKQSITDTWRWQLNSEKIHEKIAILIPSYSNVDLLKNTINDFHSILPDATICVHVSNSVAQRLKQNLPSNTIQNLRTPLRNKNNTLIAMIKQTPADCYILTNSNNTHPAVIAPILADAIINNQTDLAIASQSSKQNTVLRTLVNKIFRTNLRDASSDYRAFNNELAQSITISSNDSFELASTIHAASKNLAITEIPSPHKSPKPPKTLKTIFALIRDYRPLTFFGPVFAFFLLAGTASLAWLFLPYFATTTSDNFLLLILAVALILASLVSLSTGLILSSIAKKRHES